MCEKICWNDWWGSNLLLCSLDLGICTCDLTGNGCDVNCCCDGDCTVSDRDAFSFSCDDQYTP